VNAPKQRQHNQRRQRQSQRADPVDFWHARAALPDLRPIVPTTDPSALMRSLGELPLTDLDTRYYIATVIERAAALAAALAHAGDLLAERDAI
jgi:hypothetical protein